MACAGCTKITRLINIRGISNAKISWIWELFVVFLFCCLVWSTSRKRGQKLRYAPTTPLPSCLPFLSHKLCGLHACSPWSADTRLVRHLTLFLGSGLLLPVVNLSSWPTPVRPDVKSGRTVLAAVNRYRAPRRRGGLRFLASQ